MGEPALSVRGLTAGYGGRPVLEGLDLELRRGEVLGLLGANGAGKSTLVRAVTGQLPLLAGAVAVDGVDLAREPERAKGRLGLAMDAADLPAALTGEQYLEMVASLRGCAAVDGAASAAVRRLGLAPWMGRPIGAYSLGTRAKVALAAALVGEPPLLILDESLNGLDPLAAFELKSMVTEMARSRGRAVLLATHVVETVPGLCTRAMFLGGSGVVESWDAAALAEAGAVPGRFEAQLIAALRARRAA